MILYPSPKINIGLNVLRKREDGYHDLDTLFYPVKGMSDIISVEPADDFSFEVIGGGWDPHEDLCYKAWHMIETEFEVNPVKIVLTKRIPVGAGLGGGSSDCAALIKGLDEFFGLNLSTPKMLAMAAELGSDCPFFIYDRPCWGRGRGEILTPAGIDLSGYDIRLEMPEGEHVSTAEAYRGITPSAPAVPLEEALKRPVSEWKDFVFNDFEKSVFPAHPAIAALKQKFYDEGAVYASMTGSGAAVFGLFKK